MRLQFRLWFWVFILFTISSCKQMRRPNSSELFELLDSMSIQNQLIEREIGKRRLPLHGIAQYSKMECTPREYDPYCQIRNFLNRNGIFEVNWRTRPESTIPLQIIYTLQRNVLSDSLYQITNFPPNEDMPNQQDSVYLASQIGATHWYIVASRLDPF